MRSKSSLDNVQKLFLKELKNTDNHSKIPQIFSEIAKMSLFDIFSYKDKKKPTFGTQLITKFAAIVQKYI